MEKSVENLGLNWIEKFDMLFKVKLLEFFISKGRNVDWSEI